MRKDATLEVFQGRLSLHIHTFSDSCDNVVCAWRDLLPLVDQQVGSRLQSKTILLHRESGCLRGLPQETVGDRVRGGAWSLPLSTQGKDNRGVEMTVVVLLHRTNLPCRVKTRPWCIRVDRLPKPLEEL